jgi:hypothetical protein
MVTKEIKQFVITQMKEADWEVEKYTNSSKYTSKYLTINHGTDIVMKVNFVLRIPSGYSSYNDLIVTRKELNFNYFYYRILLRRVKKSCRLADKRRRENEISLNWKRFLEKNKDIKRNNKINQIID